MRAAELDALVLAAIDARRSGVSPEDDFVECKAQWPDPRKARQLAGLANRAAGEPIILVIGFDDSAGEVVDPGPTDPADWWAALSAQFDQAAPDLIRHRRTFVGEAEYVHAFAFDTSGAPYVVKAGDGRDVPMRDGTRTRSAYRHELLRMLLPTMHTPPMHFLKGGVLSARWHSRLEAEDEPGRRHPGRPEGISLTGTVSCFIEHTATPYLMLPAHGMGGTVSIDDWRGELDVRVYGPSEKSPPSSYGIEIRADGVLVTGPGAIPVRLNAAVPLDQMTVLESVDALRVDVSLQVAGSNRPLHVSAVLIRKSRPGRDSPHSRDLGYFVISSGVGAVAPEGAGS